MNKRKDKIMNTLHFVHELSQIFSNLKELQGGQYLVELEKEVAFAKLYIEEARDYYQCKLNISFKLSKEAQGKKIPMLTLQKLIEASIICNRNSLLNKKTIILNIYDDLPNLIVESNTFPMFFSDRHKRSARLKDKDSYLSSQYPNGVLKPFTVDENFNAVIIPLLREDNEEV